MGERRRGTLDDRPGGRIASASRLPGGHTPAPNRLRKGASMSRPVGVVVGISALALAIAGCGGEVIDDGKAEDFIRDGLEERVGVQVSSVDCPSDVDVEKGKTFDCAANTDR